MTGRSEDTIQKQSGLIQALQAQHMADQKFIDSQKRLIQVLQEKVSFLEEENQRLASTGNRLAASCETLEKLCAQQQNLLDSLTGIFSEE